MSKGPFDFIPKFTGQDTPQRCGVLKSSWEVVAYYRYSDLYATKLLCLTSGLEQLESQKEENRSLQHYSWMRSHQLLLSGA
jgi:hypothetical protein